MIQRKLAGGEEVSVNPVRNSSGALNPVRDLSLNGINPALRGGTPYGAEPGIILKPRCSRRPRLRPRGASAPEGGPHGPEGGYLPLWNKNHIP